MIETTFWLKLLKKVLSIESTKLISIKINVVLSVEHIFFINVHIKVPKYFLSKVLNWTLFGESKRLTLFSWVPISITMFRWNTKDIPFCMTQVVGISYLMTMDFIHFEFFRYTFFYFNWIEVYCQEKTFVLDTHGKIVNKRIKNLKITKSFLFESSFYQKGKFEIRQIQNKLHASKTMYVKIRVR